VALGGQRVDEPAGRVGSSRSEAAQCRPPGLSPVRRLWPRAPSGACFRCRPQAAGCQPPRRTPNDRQEGSRGHRETPVPPRGTPVRTPRRRAGRQTEDRVRLRDGLRLILLDLEARRFSRRPQPWPPPAIARSVVGDDGRGTRGAARARPCRARLAGAAMARRNVSAGRAAAPRHRGVTWLGSRPGPSHARRNAQPLPLPLTRSVVAALRGVGESHQQRLEG
jgi:hypothetical protein